MQLTISQRRTSHPHCRIAGPAYTRCIQSPEPMRAGVPMPSTPPPSGRPDAAQLRLVVSLLLSSDLARNSDVALNHSPDSLTRSPAKLEILVNSVIVFVERGFNQVTVQDLLDSANISRRTFYKYFRNKIDVLENLYKLSVDIMVLRYRADVGRATTVAEAARHMVEVFYIYHRDLAPVIRMMQEEALRHDSPLAPHRASAMSTVVALVNRELQRITGKQVDPLLVQSLFWAMEGSSIEFLRDETIKPQLIEHARQVMTDIAVASFERALANP
jgi:AcrR family transcriptional regulator